MEKDISALKEDYAKMIYHSYKNLNTTSVVFKYYICSSKMKRQTVKNRLPAK